MIDAVDIIEAVAVRLDLTVGRLLHRASKYRPQPVVLDARMVACWLMRGLLQMSYPAIAKTLGLRSHADIIRLLRLFADRPDLSGIAADLSISLEIGMPLTSRISAALLARQVPG